MRVCVGASMLIRFFCTKLFLTQVQYTILKDEYCQLQKLRKIFKQLFLLFFFRQIYLFVFQI